MVMSQSVIELIRNLCLNVFCAGWHLTVNYSLSKWISFNITRTHWRLYFI